MQETMYWLLYQSICFIWISGILEQWNNERYRNGFL